MTSRAGTYAAAPQGSAVADHPVHRRPVLERPGERVLRPPRRPDAGGPLIDGAPGHHWVAQPDPFRRGAVRASRHAGVLAAARTVVNEDAEVARRAHGPSVGARRHAVTRFDDEPRERRVQESNYLPRRTLTGTTTTTAIPPTAQPTTAHIAWPTTAARQLRRASSPTRRRRRPGCGVSTSPSLILPRRSGSAGRTRRRPRASIPIKSPLGAGPQGRPSILPSRREVRPRRRTVGRESVCRHRLQHPPTACAPWDRP